MSQRQYRSMARRRTGRQRSCLGQIAGLGVALLVILALYGLLARPALSGLLGGQISDRLGPTAPAGAIGDAADQAAAALPGAVAALPPGQIVIGQDEANAFLRDHQADYAPIDRVDLRFTQGRVEADLSALGVSGVARSGLAARDGRVALLDPQLDGALGLAISSADLLAPLADRLNAELDRQGKYVEDIQIQDGQIVIVTR